MRAITLHQPWATLIAEGRKDHETRSWAPPAQAVGARLAVHAGRTVHSVAAVDFGLDPAQLPTGGVICTCTLDWVARVERVTQDDVPEWIGHNVLTGDLVRGTVDDYGNFEPERYIWGLADVILVDPLVPARGRQGLWNFEPPTRMLRQQALHLTGGET